jgi:tRNA A-37 threonylcarbamoyl transferase component Bud32
VSEEKQGAVTLVGAILDGRYRIESLLGEGGMGAVYSATDLRLEKRVAVKVMARELAANPEALARFHREARVTSGLGHPHIVQVFDFSTTPSGEPFLVMEFLEGEDLEHRLRRLGRLPTERVLHIVKQVSSALAATHAKEIVHRDLKPANIYLLELAGEMDFVKILDFGISKVRAATTKLTKASAVMGTPNYMSPEQALGKVEEIDDTTDQWALACIAWECLSGEGPFVGENVPSILFQVVHEAPSPLTPKVAGLPPEVEEVLRCALSKKKHERFASVAAFSSALEAAITEIPTGYPRAQAAPVAPTMQLPGTSASSTAQPGTGQSTTFTRTAGELDDSMLARRSGSRRLWAMAGGAVAVVALVAFLLLRPGARTKPDNTSPVPAAAVAPAPAPVTAPAVVPAPAPTPELPPLAVPDPPKPAPAVSSAVHVDSPKPRTLGKRNRKEVAEPPKPVGEKAPSGKPSPAPPSRVAPTSPPPAATPPATTPPSQPKPRRRLINDI